MNKSGTQLPYIKPVFPIRIRQFTVIQVTAETGTVAEETGTVAEETVMLTC